MEGLGRAPARTEADLRAALAELARRAPSADDVLSAVREAGRAGSGDRRGCPASSGRRDRAGCGPGGLAGGS